MPLSISHNITNSQAANSHTATIAKTNSYSIFPRMNDTIRKKKDNVAAKHRSAIKRVMAERGLSVDPWCKKAGVTEGALRNFLNGGTMSMNANNLELLAGAIGVSLSELLGDSELKSKQSKEIDGSEAGLIKAIAVIFAIMTARGMTNDYELGEILNQQVLKLRASNQSDAVQVMESLLASLGLKPRESEIQAIRKSLKPGEGKSG